MTSAMQTFKLKHKQQKQRLSLKPEPEFDPITSSRYYSLGKVSIDRPLMPSSDVTTLCFNSCKK